jgi:hypothetical protein
MARLFVSHAANDEALVEEFVDLLHVGIGVHPDDIFCSSLPGLGIPTGKDFVEYIRSKMQSPEMVLLVLSPEFFKSQFCNNEVGASWALSIPIHPMLVPPIGYGDLKGVLAGKQAAKLDAKENLNDLRDDLTALLKITPLRTSHWERKRDKFLAKLEALTRTLQPVVGSQSAGSASSPNVVTTSGSIFKLGDRFFEAERVLRPSKDKISIELFSTSGEEEAVLDSLRPHQHSNRAVLGFAYQNDGGIVQIEKVASSSHGGRNSWTVELSVREANQNAFSEINYENHSADDIAEMRAGRLLINDPPPPKKPKRGMRHDFLEYAIVGSDDAVKIDECVVRRILSQSKNDLEAGMKRARLEAVFRLKATGIVASIHELSLGPLNGNKLHVRFRGQRPRHYQNVEPEIITIDGDCELSD